MQTKLQSAIEITISTACGFLVSWLVQITLIPWMLGVEITAHSGFWITVVFTVISLIRSYAFRRLFNWLHTAEVYNGKCKRPAN